jgi:hypothetical protein
MVFEYAYVEQFNIRAWIGDNDEKNMVPIHRSRLTADKLPLLIRQEEGVRLLSERIHMAAGE